jgi:hypothetical protein
MEFYTIFPGVLHGNYSCHLDFNQVGIEKVGVESGWAITREKRLMNLSN